jgi:hypothetical protein
MNKQQNGNNQLNQIRNEYNNRVEKKFILGNAARIFWNNLRRFRTI